MDDYTDWTCPKCDRNWVLDPLDRDEDEEWPKESAEACPKCGEPPSEFTPGEIVRADTDKGPTLGVVKEADRCCVRFPRRDMWLGPFTGKYLILVLDAGESEGRYPPETLAQEAEVFLNLPEDPMRRVRLFDLLACDNVHHLPVTADELTRLSESDLRALLKED